VQSAPDCPGTSRCLIAQEQTSLVIHSFCTAAVSYPSRLVKSCPVESFIVLNCKTNCTVCVWNHITLYKSEHLFRLCTRLRLICDNEQQNRLKLCGAAGLLWNILKLCGAAGLWNRLKLCGAASLLWNWVLFESIRIFPHALSFRLSQHRRWETVCDFCWDVVSAHCEKLLSLVSLHYELHCIYV
jgi:hypothetical protein